MFGLILPLPRPGLKVNDALLEINGKAVSNEPRELGKLIADIKTDASVDIVVKRKGKKETIKVASLPEAKPAGGSGMGYTNTNINRSGDRLTITHQDGTLNIMIRGTVADGKVRVSGVQVTAPANFNTYKTVDEVPEKFQEKVKKLISVGEKCP